MTCKMTAGRNYAVSGNMVITHTPSMQIRGLNWKHFDRYNYTDLSSLTHKYVHVSCMGSFDHAHML